MTLNFCNTGHYLNDVVLLHGIEHDLLCSINLSDTDILPVEFRPIYDLSKGFSLKVITMPQSSSNLFLLIHTDQLNYEKICLYQFWVTSLFMQKRNYMVHGLLYLIPIVSN